MKTSTNKKELRELNACTSGLRTFIAAHGSADARFSQCLTSNGWDDVWWLVSNTYSQFSDEQKADLRLLSCEYALSVIEKFEKEFPEDKRPREAIEVAQKFAKGGITSEELEAAAAAAAAAARSAARSAASAHSAAYAAAYAAAASAYAARSAAYAAAWSAAWSASAVMRRNEEMLMELFLKWEKTNA